MIMHFPQFNFYLIILLNLVCLPAKYHFVNSISNSPLIMVLKNNPVPY